MINWDKLFSKEFLLSLAAIITDIVVGIGYNLDPAVITGIAGAIAAIYAIVQGVLESVKTNAATKVEIARIYADASVKAAQAASPVKAKE
jgi:hypothetical protein